MNDVVNQFKRRKKLKFDIIGMLGRKVDDNDYSNFGQNIDRTESFRTNVLQEITKVKFI